MTDFQVHLYRLETYHYTDTSRAFGLQDVDYAVAYVRTDDSKAFYNWMRENFPQAKYRGSPFYDDDLLSIEMDNQDAMRFKLTFQGSTYEIDYSRY